MRINERHTGALVIVMLAMVSGCAGSETMSPATSSNVSATSATPPSTAPATTRSTISSTTPPTTNVPSTTAPTTAATPTPTTAATPTPTPTTTEATTSSIVDVAPTIDELVGTFAQLAHAGGDQEAPHSTRFAFEQAVAAGATALELDVQLTADGVLVVQHDDTVDKTTETTGPVGDLTLDELQALDNAYWFSPECWPCQDRPPDEYVYRGVRTGKSVPPAGFTADDFRVPTFREIAEAFPQLPLDIEIKGTGSGAEATAERLAIEIVELDRTQSVVVVSFDDSIVDVFRSLAPDVETSPGLQRLTAWFLGEAELDAAFRVLQLPPKQGEIDIITADLVDRLHNEGRIVWVWADDASTQENEAFYRSLIDLGVDGIIAGRPRELAAASAD